MKFLLSGAIFLLASTLFAEENPWVVYEGKEGPGKGKHIVLVSGDQEYRSEEALPMLGQVLAKHHGFKCTVLFAIEPKTGLINPLVDNHIPGLEALKTADLMIIATRFRNLPEDQMKHFEEFLTAGKPIIGLRTATHGFITGGKTYGKYHYSSKVEGWEGGFGRKYLGETWINHHGAHGSQATRGIPAKDAEKSPILRGIGKGEIFGPSDVYTVRLPLPEGCLPVVMGEVVKGMKYDDPALEGGKNAPMMPVAWTRELKAGDKVQRVFTTTMGASQDLIYEGTRRMVVNASYWCLGMEKDIPEKAKVDFVTEYKPTAFRFLPKDFKATVKPSDLKWKE